jgi:hypothetical protein
MTAITLRADASAQLLRTRARVLAAVSSLPQTTAQIADASGLSSNGAYAHLRAAATDGEIVSQKQGVRMMWAQRGAAPDPPQILEAHYRDNGHRRLADPPPELAARAAQLQRSLPPKPLHAYSMTELVDELRRRAVAVDTLRGRL